MITNIESLSPKDIRQISKYRDIFKLAFHPFTRRKLEEVLSEYEGNINATIYGLFHKKKIIGIIGYELIHDRLIIKQLAIAEKEQGEGNGKKLIDHVISLENPLHIQAETDDDAVGFYRKLKFSCSSFASEYGNKRYKCILQRLKRTT